jgi:uncharacterized protein YdbL (DUF1318 family)
MVTQRTLVFIAAVSALLVGTARADTDSELATLRQRSEARYTELQKLKTAGTIGETYLGFLANPPAATPDEKAKKLVDEENADRKRVYALLAEKEGSTTEKVADRAARRNFARAKSGEWLLFPNGQWGKKG